MRSSYAAQQIPASGSVDVPYVDQRTLVQGILRHSAEKYVQKITGAGGAGGSIAAVPFQPAIVEAINQAGGAPAYYKSVFASDAAIHMSVILATAANATPPVLTDNGDGTWKVALPTAMAPDGEVVTVVITGVNDIAGGL